MPVTRSTLRKAGKATRERLGQPAARAGRSVPGYGDWADEVIYGGIWSRPGLALQDRMICTLAALSLLQRVDALKSMVGTALDIGLPPRAVVEVFMQAGLYGGFPTTEASAACASDVFAARSVSVADEPERTDSNEALDARGQELMARMHGERGQQGYAAPGNAITGALYPSAVRYGYGELWFRPGLVHRQRMLVAVASFTVLGLEAQLRKFAQSALNMGLPRNEIVEAVIQTAPYGGFPRALNGLAILSEVLPTDA
ncbi:MAG: carboxymuconolactone decarboxylase family protein [Hyphomicrobiaceae bacterium]